MKYGDLTLGQVEAIVNKLGGMEGVQGLLSGAMVVVWSFIQSTYKVVVDYGQTLVQMIEAGRYDWVNDSVTADHFPIFGKGKVEGERVLFHFNRVISEEDAIAEMDKAGYEPDDIAGLLALGKSNPELQRQFPIIALKSVWQGSNGHRDVPYLDRFGSERYLNLHYLGNDFLSVCRFLARRKCQQS